MRKQKKKSELREWVESLVVAAVIAFGIIRPFIIEPFKIPTGSMRPTLLEGDLILVSKFTYGARVPFTNLRLPGLSKPKRGDVIVFRYPVDLSKNFIKRLIAFEGEGVEIKDGSIYIDQRPLLGDLFSKRYYYNRGEFAREGQKITVPELSYFVLGDNSGSSQDSRYWGYVPKRNLVGKAIVIFWPPHRIRMIK
ncbi:MAG: signal peptidase I [Candidatus Omnitrophica bacterium]|nr:signal peptidase I [Candidatus Omnitrophota bacterium]